MGMTVTWRGRVGEPWPTPPAGAWCLSRPQLGPVSKPTGWQQWFDCADPAGLRPRPAPRHARRGVTEVNKVDVYARRLGVLPQAYGFALGHAHHQLTGTRPSLKKIGELLDESRLREWDRSKAAFKAARAAREWAYLSDPLGGLERAENDREALRRFARGQRGRPSKRSRKRNRKRPADPPVRRSTRKRKRPKDNTYHWNFQDKYVLDVDEYTAPTTRTMNTVAMTIVKQKRRLCKLV